LEAIKNPEHEEHESMLEWVGGEFDPDEFDMNMINKRLDNLK
ncbi:MAG: plasmid pRiA4b ORF-3 family protein, partial [Desulfamplus sp.]|nr:plasmid pRiA4b ORF-3 family protein [Desulfamplus sp.]